MNRRNFLATTMCACAASLEAGTLPRAAAPLEIVQPDGSKFGLSKYAGKVVCVEFLFTTCPHCQETSKILTRLHKEYGPRGFQPIGVAFNEGAMMLVPEFVRQFGASYPVGVASRDSVLSFLEYSQMTRLMVPQVAFLDRKGTVRLQSSNSGEEVMHSEANLRKHIEELLKEPTTAAKTPAKAAPKAK